MIKKCCSKNIFNVSKHSWCREYILNVAASGWQWRRNTDERMRRHVVWFIDECYFYWRVHKSITQNLVSLWKRKVLNKNMFYFANSITSHTVSCSILCFLKTTYEVIQKRSEKIETERVTYKLKWFKVILSRRYRHFGALDYTEISVDCLDFDQQSALVIRFSSSEHDTLSGKWFFSINRWRKLGFYPIIRVNRDYIASFQK